MRSLEFLHLITPTLAQPVHPVVPAVPVAPKVSQHSLHASPVKVPKRTRLLSENESSKAVEIA